MTSVIPMRLPMRDDVVTDGEIADAGAGQRALDRGRLFPRAESDRVRPAAQRALSSQGHRLDRPDLPDARRGARSAQIAGDFERRNHARPISRRWSARKALNAFVVETPEKALAMAAASDARLAKGEGGPLEGLPIGVKDLYATEGVHTQACSHILDGFKPTYESTVTANLWRDGAVMLGKLNMDEFAMGSSNETSYYGPVASPWLPPNWSRDQARAALARRQARPAGARRLVGRLGGRGRRAPLPGRDRERHRRLDPPARRLHRHRRHQADLRALLALGHGGLRLVARSGRTARPHRARRGDHAALDGRPRSEGFDLLDRAGSRLRGRGRPVGQGPDDRHAEGISARRHERRDRGAVGARRRMAARGGRKRRRREPAQHAPRAACLLYCRAGRGLEQSRALRRRALWPARARVRHRRPLREDARARLRRARCGAG